MSTPSIEEPKGKPNYQILQIEADLISKFTDKIKIDEL